MAKIFEKEILMRDAPWTTFSSCAQIHVHVGTYVCTHTHTICLYNFLFWELPIIYGIHWESPKQLTETAATSLYYSTKFTEFVRFWNCTRFTVP